MLFELKMKKMLAKKIKLYKNFYRLKMLENFLSLKKKLIIYK